MINERQRFLDGIESMPYILHAFKLEAGRNKKLVVIVRTHRTALKMSEFVDPTPSGEAQLACHPREWLQSHQHLVHPYRIFELSPRDMDNLVDPLVPTDEENLSSDESWGSPPPPPAPETSNFFTGLEVLCYPRLPFPSPPPPPEVNREEEEEEDEEEDEEDEKLNLELINIGKSLARDFRNYAIAEIRTYEGMLESIDKAIKELGGAVVPKVNWKVPKDARWLALNKSLKCQSKEDVLLLIRHSNQVDASVEQATSLGLKIHSLVLKKWDETIGPETEFRCFVMDGKLVCISQQDTDQAHTYIVTQRDIIINEITHFFKHHLKGCSKQFHRLKNYVFDVVHTPKGVALMDFDAFGADPKLASYKELEDMAKAFEDGKALDSPFFKYATVANVARPHKVCQCPLPLEIMTHFAPDN